jgi:hypothetical protein
MAITTKWCQPFIGMATDWFVISGILRRAATPFPYAHGGSIEQLRKLSQLGSTALIPVQTSGVRSFWPNNEDCHPSGTLSCPCGHFLRHSKALAPSK